MTKISGSPLPEIRYILQSVTLELRKQGIGIQLLQFSHIPPGTIVRLKHVANANVRRHPIGKREDIPIGQQLTLPISVSTRPFNFEVRSPTQILVAGAEVMGSPRL
jgi:hypothetical protein